MLINFPILRSYFVFCCSYCIVISFLILFQTKFKDRERILPYQCSGGLAENKCKTSDGLDFVLEWKDGNHQIGMWLDSNAEKSKYDIMTYPIQNPMMLL